MLEGLKRGNPSSKAYGDHAAGVMIDIVRSVASSNNLVGRGLMIIVMPKWAIHPGQESTSFSVIRTDSKEPHVPTPASR